jgi:hypothetical protein
MQIELFVDPGQLQTQSDNSSEKVSTRDKFHIYPKPPPREIESKQRKVG